VCHFNFKLFWRRLKELNLDRILCQSRSQGTHPFTVVSRCLLSQNTRQGILRYVDAQPSYLPAKKDFPMRLTLMAMTDRCPSVGSWSAGQVLNLSPSPPARLSLAWRSNAITPQPKTGPCNGMAAMWDIAGSLEGRPVGVPWIPSRNIKTPNTNPAIRQSGNPAMMLSVLSLQSVPTIQDKAWCHRTNTKGQSRMMNPCYRLPW